MLHKVSNVARAMKMNNDALAMSVIIVSMLSGCNQEDYQAEVERVSYRSDIFHLLEHCMKRRTKLNQ